MGSNPLINQRRFCGGCAEVGAAEFPSINTRDTPPLPRGSAPLSGWRTSAWPKTDLNRIRQMDKPQHTEPCGSRPRSWIVSYKQSDPEEANG